MKNLKELILAESARQIEKYGELKEDKFKFTSYYFNILVKEVGRIAEAVLSSNREELLNNCIKNLAFTVNYIFYIVRKEESSIEDVVDTLLSLEVREFNISIYDYTASLMLALHNLTKDTITSFTRPFREDDLYTLSVRVLSLYNLIFKLEEYIKSNKNNNDESSDNGNS